MAHTVKTYRAALVESKSEVTGAIEKLRSATFSLNHAATVAEPPAVPENTIRSSAAIEAAIKVLASAVEEISADIERYDEAERQSKLFQEDPSS